MALQVWLPLNGNLNNQGLSNATITNNGATVDNNGKIGKCYRFENNSKYLTLSKKCCDLFNDGDSFSYCLWIKITAYSTSTSGSGTGGTVIYLSESSTVNGETVKGGGFGILINTSGSAAAYVNPFNGSFGINIGTIPLDVWTHLCMTYDKTLKKLSVYLNGQFIRSSIATSDWGSNGRNFKFGIGSQGGWTHSSDNYQNDIRIYDHCLSPKEVHEIAKGLVLHWKLDANGNGSIGNINLVKNGWGGTENWNSTNYSTTELPPVTGITHSYYNCSTKEFIPIISNHTYEISSYVKTKTGSGHCYVALIPYDVDKNRISFDQTGRGFRASSLTTLAQDLKNGDTIIYLTNASGWANPSQHQYGVAIFGYCDSTGYKYPDLVYTRRTYKFGTTSDKSHLNISNNTVTLNNPYSGQTIPKGTSICLTGYGGAYYYPINFAASGATDWVLKSITFVPRDENYLKSAKYVKVSSIGGYQYLAGITLKDLSANNIIYDCSGYNHRGTTVGSLFVDQNTPKYNYCLGNTTEYPCKLETSLDFPESSGLTMCCWINLTTWGAQNSGLWATSNLTDPTDYSITTCNHRDSYFDMRGTNGTTYRLSCGVSDVPLNTWKFVVITHDGTNAKLYINGTLIRTLSIPTPLVSFKYLYLGYSKAGGAIRKCQGMWSDFRIYATALSDVDIKELYDTPTFIDNQGNLISGEFNEDNENFNVLKQGITKTNKFIEVKKYIYLPAGTWIDTGLYYNDGDKCKAETIIKYENNGSGRDLMGYSGSGGGYWGVKADGTWESHGTFTYTNSDITQKNTIVYIFSSATEHGTYKVGALGSSYTVRNKYIYNVRLYKNDILERDLYPIQINDKVGLFDILHNEYYLANNTNGTLLNNDVIDTCVFKNKVESTQFLEI